MSKCVLYTVDGGVATITLNRPERMNAWNAELIDEMRSSVEQAADQSVRAVIITGAGRAFSSGADLKDMGSFLAGGQPSVEVSTLLEQHYHPLLVAIKGLEKPVLAAINGPAAGIGLSLALTCDLVLAKRSAIFLMPFVSIGLMADGGSTALLPIAVGRAKAFELTMLSEPIDAVEAERIGLIARVVEDDRFEGEVAALAHRLAAGPTVAYASLKRALNAATLAGIESQLALEAELQDRCAATEDFREGVAAFIEKREPQFKGR